MNRRHFALGLLAATSTTALIGPSSAQAPAAPGAIPAMQYLAMASKGGTFLEETARTGFDKTPNPSLRRFARAEVLEQVGLDSKLNAASGSMAGMAPRSPGGLVGAVVAAPVAVAGAAVGVAGAIVGLGGAPMTSDAQKAQMIAQLNGLPAGPAFDAQFVQVQLMGHEEALAIHGSYAQSGDDPELRRVARNALPLIRQHIAQLSRVQRSMSAAPVG